MARKPKKKVAALNLDAAYAIAEIWVAQLRADRLTTRFMDAMDIYYDSFTVDPEYADGIPRVAFDVLNDSSINFVIFDDEAYDSVSGEDLVKFQIKIMEAMMSLLG